MNRVTKHFVALDGLRGIAVLLVVLSHLSNFGFPLLFIDFSGIGKCGVYLFFVLSAFLLTHQFFEKGVSNSFSLPALGNYLWRRSLRVLPLFYLVVIASALTTYFFSAQLNGRGLPFTIPVDALLPHLFLQAGTEVLWSVSVEFKFYFLLPIFAGCFLLTRKKGIYLDIAITVSAIIASTYFFPPGKLPGGAIELGYYLPVFICGCFCASAVHKISFRNDGQLANVIAVVTALLVFLTVPSIYSRLISPVQPSHFHQAIILYGVLWSVFLYAVLHAKGWLLYFLSSQPLIFLGKISFSLYLLHFPILLITRKLAPGSNLAAWIAVAAIIAISYFSYRVIERPLSRLQLPDILRVSATSTSPSN